MLISWGVSFETLKISSINFFLDQLFRGCSKNTDTLHVYQIISNLNVSIYDKRTRKCIPAYMVYLIVVDDQTIIVLIQGSIAFVAKGENFRVYSLVNSLRINFHIVKRLVNYSACICFTSLTIYIALCFLNILCWFLSLFISLIQEIWLSFFLVFASSFLFLFYVAIKKAFT